MKISGIALALALPPGLASPHAASATEPRYFPAKPVRWVVPYPPGGSIDVVARVIAARLSHAWGVSCSVENRPGAGGRVLEESDARRQLIGFGTDLVTVTPDDMARRICIETASWTKVIQGSSIRFD